jgi:pimeloyl-ACP methyl ester carboxylesterase
MAGLAQRCVFAMEAEVRRSCCFMGIRARMRPGTWSLRAWRRTTLSCAPICADTGSRPKVAPYTKRAMACDVVGVMRTLDHERFAVVGHDRGSYVATRLALEHQARVERLVVLEAMPLVERLERTDWRFALSWWHWWFFGKLGKPAEALINADPDACALHRIAITQSRVHPPARAYLERKQAEGKSRREAIRCLKRQLVRVVFHTLKASPTLT